MSRFYREPAVVDAGVPHRPSASPGALVWFTALEVFVALPLAWGAPPAWLWLIGLAATHTLSIIAAVVYGSQLVERAKWDRMYGADALD